MNRRARILLVEDSSVQAMRLTDMLMSAGHKVRHVVSAENALLELNRELPDLMLVDYHLPGLQGDELCRQVRLNVGTFSMPIIMLTADGSAQCQRVGLESGADDFIPKSGNPDLILARVRHQLRRMADAPDDLPLPRAAFRLPEMLVVGAPPSLKDRLIAALHREGCRVEWVPDAETGVQRVRERVFDGVIVASVMEDPAAFHPLKEAAQGEPAFILLQDAADGARTMRALEAGADDCIDPHPDFALLRARLRATLRRRFLAEQNRRILDAALAQEREALQLRTAREAAEARAAMADELRTAHERLTQAYERLEAQAAVTRTIAESIAAALFMVDTRGFPTYMNPAAEALLGYRLDDLRGRSLFDTILEPSYGHPSDGPPGQIPSDARRRDGGLVPVILTITALEGGGSVVQMVDVTERRQAEQQQAILMAELSHRVKNTLATVTSIAAQTRRRHEDVSSFWDAFSGRLRALSSTHNLLARHHWRVVGLAEVVASELAPYRGETEGSLTLAGPDVQLDPKAALALGMIFHELATNAAKYGAFSTPSGRVDVAWSMAREEGGADHLCIGWTESGGPTVHVPSHTGFGTRLIETGLAYELGGRTRREFRPDGLRVRLDIPLSGHVRMAQNHETGSLRPSSVRARWTEPV